VKLYLLFEEGQGACVSAGGGAVRNPCEAQGDLPLLRGVKAFTALL
jgi:hypothetical protein